MIASSILPLISVPPANANDQLLLLIPPTTQMIPSPPTFGISDKVLSSLVYERILGQGTFKNVYLVTGYNDIDGSSVRYAMAMERLRSKSDARDAIRGVRIAEQLQDMIHNDADKLMFVIIEDWWIQSTGVPDFAPGAHIFDTDRMAERSQKDPGKFLGSKWLLSFKPVYDMDLKKFAQRSPTLYPIVESVDPNDIQKADVVAGMPLTEDAAVKLALNICHAGRIMHESGLVHRDIKPKNIMLSNGRPIIIDFGFAQFGRPAEGKEKKRMCVVQQGQVKGEVRYVLSEDVAKFRGCQEGDAYAMGKSMYDTIFDTARGPEASAKQPITETEAELQNDKFRSILFREGAGTVSRFLMSRASRDYILSTIRGLCRRDSPMAFAEAEMYLKQRSASLL